MAPPFSSSDYVTTSSGEDLKINSIDNTHIINGTITGTDIATGTITNANFVDGTITFEKLSSALQTKLEDFNTRIIALENAVPPSNTGFNGSITINHDGPAWQMYIVVRADGTERYNQAPTSFTTTTFSIGTQFTSTATYLYMYVSPAGSYGISSSGFAEEGVIFIGYETIGGLIYQKYSISSTLTNATLVYNINTYDDD
jgi:hypothetical protein